MKRVSVLAFLLALSPLSWAGKVVEEAAVVPPAEAMDVDSENVAEPTPQDEVTSSPASTEAVAADVSKPDSQVTVVPVSEKAVVSPSTSEGSSSVSHKVVRGDTLWDLAGEYLQNPFLWPKIFDANRDKIENPRLIFPNQEFVIPTVEAAETMAATPPPTEEVSVAPPAPAPAEVEVAPEPEAVSEVPSSTEDVSAGEPDSPKAMAAPEEIVAETPEDMDEKTLDEREAKKKRSQAVPGAGFMGGTADSFLADENWEYDGYVLRDRDQRMMISQGDVVFLNIGAASGVKPKMVAHVYRVGKKVKDPYLKKKTGRMVKRVGSVMVTGQVTDEGCTAVVTNSLEPIRIGDIVKFIAR
jgi:LysM repeat protein